MGPGSSPQMVASGSSNPSPPRQRTAPSAWPNAEQEKLKLYDDARSRAVISQSASGAGLDTIGMDGPPPEYEPPPPGDPHYIPLATDSSGSKLHRSNTGLETMYTAPESPERNAAVSSDGPSHSQAGPSRPAQTMDSAYMSAAEEKEQQRRRFAEAQNRVASGGSTQYADGQASPTQSTHSELPDAGPSVPAPVAGVGSSSGDRASLDVAPGSSEKEQMKRYYEAQDRVNRNDPGASPPQSVESHLPDMPGSWGSAPVSSAVGPMRLASVAPTISDKEQLRRFHEAQDRVARNADAGESSGNAPAMEASRSLDKPNGVGSAGASPAAGSGTVVGSSLGEKEQMRRYYDAQDRVNRGASGSSQPHSDTGHQAGPSGYMPDSPQTPTPSAGPSFLPFNKPSTSSRQDKDDSTAPSKQGYMSAAAEREMMQKRFESAQDAVRRKTSNPIDSPPSTTDATSDAPPPAFDDSDAGMTSRNDRDARYSYTSPLAREVLARANRSRPVSRAMEEPDRPPPPLPAKPPMEYINLLSPVHEVPPADGSIARWPGGGQGVGLGMRTTSGPGHTGINGFGNTSPGTSADQDGGSN